MEIRIADALTLVLACAAGLAVADGAFAVTVPAGTYALTATHPQWVAAYSPPAAVSGKAVREYEAVIYVETTTRARPNPPVPRLGPQSNAAEKAAPLVIGDTFTMDSKSLGETRRINVYLPPGYDRHRSQSLVEQPGVGQWRGRAAAFAAESGEDALFRQQ